MVYLNYWTAGVNKRRRNKGACGSRDSVVERLEVTDPLRSEQNNGNGKKLQLCEQNQDCFAKHSVRSEQDEDGRRRCCETLDVHRNLYKNLGVE